MLPPPVLFVIYVLSSIGVATYGKKRKFGYWGYFFASLLLTPLIGILLVVSSEEADTKEKTKSNAAEPID